MAASGAQKLTLTGAKSVGFLNVYTALTLYSLARASLRLATHGTAASAGDIAPSANAKGQIPLGFAKAKGNAEGVTGDSTAPESCPVELGAEIGLNIPVTGATTEAVSVGYNVYASDDNTYTLTRPAAPTLPVGFVLRWHSSGVADVYFYSLAEMLAMKPRTVLLGSFPWASGDADKVTSRIWGDGRAKITRIFGVVETALVGSSGTIAYNMEIGTTNVTGGVVTATVALGTAGVTIAGTAVTAANEISDGDAFSIEGSGAGGTRTSGQVALYAEIEPLPGL